MANTVKTTTANTAKGMDFFAELAAQTQAKHSGQRKQADIDSYSSMVADMIKLAQAAKVKSVQVGHAQASHAASPTKPKPTEGTATAIPPVESKAAASTVCKPSQSAQVLKTDSLPSRETHSTHPADTGFFYTPAKVASCEVYPTQPTEETLPTDTTTLFGIPDESVEEKTRPDGRLRVAAYIRVSSENESQEDSYELQDRYFTKLLAQNPGWVSAGVYSDYGISGTSRAKRTGFNRLIRHCEEGRIDRIICKSISRFSRNTADFLVAVRILRKKGVSVLFEKENLDTADPTNEFILTTLGALAQQESLDRSDAMTWGNQKRYPKGEIQNIAIYGYRFTGEYEETESGYRIKQVEIVEEEAEVVRRIFKEYNEGSGLSEIARGLNYSRIAPPEAGNAKKHIDERRRQTLIDITGEEEPDLGDSGWTAGRIGYMIDQERYAGCVLAQKTYTKNALTHETKKNKGEMPQFYIRDHHPAIITEETFQRAQFLRRGQQGAGQERNEPFSRTKWPFSGILVCGNCGRKYNVRNGSANPIWFCPGTKTSGIQTCNSERVYEEQLVRMFRKAVVERFDLCRGSAEWGLRGAGELDFTDKSQGFLDRLTAQLEHFQRDDYMEKERTFIKRKLYVMHMEANKAERRRRVLRSKLKTLTVQRDLMQKEVSGEEIQRLESALADAGLEGGRARQAMEMEEAKLEQLERYWEEVEACHGYRSQALEWMHSLPGGREGLEVFLNGMRTEYVRAFVLEVAIFSPLQFRVRWYDNTVTEVELYSNVDEGRGLAV